MNTGDYSGIFVARLLHDINKYKPSTGDFSIPSIMNDSGTLSISQTLYNNTSSVANQNTANLGISNSTVTKSIKIAIPREIVYFYPQKIIPKGTIFFVMFVGNDINKPIIIGRDINGYIDTKTNSNG